MRTGFAFWAGAWVLLVAGCADMTGFLVFQGAPGDRVVAGSLDAVAKTTQERLEKRFGLHAVITPVGETVEVESATPEPHKQRFKLVLTREASEKSEQGAKTRMKLVWIDEKHDYFAALILKMFEE
jgi:hypothetical protein